MLSALGLVVSERRRDLVESVLLSGDELTAERGASRRAARARAAARSSGGAGTQELRASYDLRYAGQAFELTVPGDAAPDPEELRAAFDRAHEERYGYADPTRGLELVTVRVAVARRAPSRARLRGRPRRRRGDGARWFAGEARRSGARAGPGRSTARPSASWPSATLVVPPGWRGRSRTTTQSCWSAA